MYPLDVITVGVADSAMPELRKQFGCLAARVEAELPGLAELTAHVGPAPVRPRLLVTQLRSHDDLRTLDRINTAYPGWPVIALVEGDVDPPALYDINRSGASQMLPLPLTGDDLAAAARRIVVQFGLRLPAPRVVAVSGVVEGAGATSLAVNLAAELARLDPGPVVLAELTLPMGRLAARLNVTPQTTTRDLLSTSATPTLADVQQALVPFDEHMMVLAGPYRSLEPLKVEPYRILTLVRQLRHLAGWVVLDMPYTFDDTYFAVLADANAAVLVAEPTVDGAQALKLVRDTLVARDPGVVIFPVVNRHRAREELTVTKMAEVLRLPKVWPVAHDAEGFAAELAAGKPLVEVAPQSRARADLRRLARAVSGHPPEVESKTWWAWLRQRLGV